MKNKSSQKLNNENVWHVKVKKVIIIHLFVYSKSFFVSILAKFHCFTSSLITDLEAKWVVPQLSTTDSEHCWWYLLWYNFYWILCGVINPWCNEFDLGNVKNYFAFCAISQHWNGQPVEIIAYRRKRPVYHTRSQGLSNYPEAKFGFLERLTNSKIYN